MIRWPVSPRGGGGKTTIRVLIEPVAGA